MTEVNEKSPKVIAAKTGGQWEILHLHVPNEYDRFYEHYYFYYDDGGNEIPLGMIENYVVLED